MAENQTQQRDQDVVAYEAFSGLRNEVSPERFTQGDLAAAVNVDLDKTGRLARRDGYTQLAPGAMHSLWADAQGQICLFVANQTLYQLNADYTRRALAPLSDQSGASLSYCRVNDRVYFSNGLDRGILDNGVVRTWGLPVPVLPMVSATVGSMSGGTYQFAITQLRADGQESGAAALAGVIDLPDSSAITFALPPVADSSAVTRAIYLTTANGTVLYLAALVPAGTEFFTYGDDTVQLNLPLATQGLSAPPAGQIVAYYRGRLYVAVDDTLYMSRPYAYELFDLREYIQMDGRITMLAPIVDKELRDAGRSSGFFIGTDRSCGVLVGSDPAEFQYVPKTQYGAIPGALSYVEGSLFGDNSQGARDLPMWLTQQGICVGMSDLTVNNLTRSKYQFSASGQGAATFLSGPNRFIASSNL
jgi:hypothetical protein